MKSTNTKFKSTGNHSYKMQTNQDVQKGQELFSTYGKDLNNEELLLRYGHGFVARF